jgi:ribosomal protein S18 acetylase RimI-like enzyme
VLPDPYNPTCIQGFYTLSSYSLRADDLPEKVRRKLPRYPDVPAALIGWLAVDLAYRGRNLGEHLVLDAMRKVVAHSRALGTALLIIDADDDELAAYYQELGFIPLPSKPRRLFILVETIAQIL